MEMNFFLSIIYFALLCVMFFHWRVSFKMPMVDSNEEGGLSKSRSKKKKRNNLNKKELKKKEKYVAEHDEDEEALEDEKEDDNINNTEGVIDGECTIKIRRLKILLKRNLKHPNHHHHLSKLKTSLDGFHLYLIELLKKEEGLPPHLRSPSSTCSYCSCSCSSCSSSCSSCSSSRSSSSKQDLELENLLLSWFRLNSLGIRRKPSLWFSKIGSLLLVLGPISRVPSSSQLIYDFFLTYIWELLKESPNHATLFHNILNILYSLQFHNLFGFILDLIRVHAAPLPSFTSFSSFCSSSCNSCSSSATTRSLRLGSRPVQTATVRTVLLALLTIQKETKFRETPFTSFFVSTLTDIMHKYHKGIKPPPFIHSFQYLVPGTSCSRFPVLFCLFPTSCSF
jgi:hypothetical protein